MADWDVNVRLDPPNVVPYENTSTFHGEGWAVVPLGTHVWFSKTPHYPLHRDDDLPAIEYADGGKEWWVNGKRHRDGDKPAVETFDGRKEWWFNGKRHRDRREPAVIWPKGSRRFAGGPLPAVVEDETITEWWEHGWWRKTEVTYPGPCECPVHQLVAAHQPPSLLQG
jgi:hypothetical protein